MENKIILKYLKREEYRIRIFGEQFVKNNKDKLKLEIDGKIRELTEFYYNKNRGNKNEIIEISLLGFEKITNMSRMFSYCSSLLPLFDVSKMDISNVNDISEIFYDCSLLSALPDISK